MSWFHKNHDDCINEMIASVGQESYLISQKEANELLYSANIPDELSTLLMIENCNIFAPIIFDMNWQFATAPSGYSFITSDNPVILIDPNREQIMPSFMGWKNTNAELIFPINPEMCMKATWTKKKSVYVKADTKFIKHANFWISTYSNRYIFLHVL